MKKLLLFFIFLPIVIHSQNITINGTVSDEIGSPLPGVSILVKNSDNIGTVSDFDGNYSIELPSELEKVLIFSYIGFSSQEIDVSNQSQVDVTLASSQTELDEVVIVGYGTVLKKDVTGSLAEVTVSDAIRSSTNSVDQLLQGRAAGVQVIQNLADPGSGISVRIRGANSLRGNNEPLYVIDGVIISSAGEDVASAGVGMTGQDAQNGLAGINPRDIEEIRVLKDASATAIYGSRGANGVVLITTKKGKSGEIKINTFVNTSVRTVSKKYDVLNGRTYANYVNEWDTIGGEEPRYQVTGSQVFRIGGGELEDNTTPSSVPAQLVDWQSELYQQGFSTKVGASASGGSENGNYYISAGFDNQEGIVKNSNLKSGDFRINLNQNLNDNLKLEARFSSFFSSLDAAESGDLQGGNNSSFIRAATGFRPVITSLDDEDDLGLSNPFSWIEDFTDASVEKRFIGSLGLTYKLPVRGLSYQIKAGGNIRTKDRRRFWGLSTFNGFSDNGQLQITTLNSNSYQINNVLRYNRSFNQKHRINGVLGVTYDARNVDSSVYAAYDFVTVDFTTQQPGFGQNTKVPLRYGQSDQEIFSVLGRLNYTYDNKYTLTATFRRDGVSKFTEGNQYGTFPSFAFAWNAGNEELIKGLNIFEDLKIRAGWGQIGNHGISPYGTFSNYGVSDRLYGNSGGGANIPIVLLNLANTGLTWETTEQVNFGLDFSTRNNIFSGNIDVYQKDTKDLLQNANIPTSSGFSNILVNQGEISNKGLELALNITPISTDDFELSFGGNIAFNQTKIESLEAQPLADLFINNEIQQRKFYLGNTVSPGNTFKYPANIFIEGEESSLFYGFETDGIYQVGDSSPGGSLVQNVSGQNPAVDLNAPIAGDIKIKDLNGDGIINLQDRTTIGNPNPDFVYGFNINLRSNGFTASILFNGVQGNEIVNGNNLKLGLAEGQLNFNVLNNTYNNAWRLDNPSNTVPRFGYTTDGQQSLTDFFVEDGSYLRLNNITIGYDVPVQYNALIDKMNVYITGQNLFTWTNYSGYDPEITNFLYTGLINGVDFNGRPNAQTILLGLNINF